MNKISNSKKKESDSVKKYVIETKWIFISSYKTRNYLNKYNVIINEVSNSIKKESKSALLYKIFEIKIKSDCYKLIRKSLQIFTIKKC